MAIFIHAYVDESGKLDDKDVVVLCGYAAPWQTWDLFIQEWDDMLDAKGIPYLHVSQLMRWDPPFDSKKDEWGADGRDRALLEFAGVINRHLGRGRGLGIGVGLNAKHWKTMKSEDRRRMGKPDLLVFEFFIAFLLWRHFDLVREDYRLGLTFDDSGETAKRFYDLLFKAKQKNPDAAAKIPSICFADDKVYKPLQAADLLANSCYGEMKRRCSQSREGESELYKRLTYPTAFLGLSLDAPTLDNLAAAWPISRIDFLKRFAHIKEDDTNPSRS